MTKYTKADISEVYRAETHPLLDDEDRVGEISTDRRDYLFFSDDQEDLEYDDYEPDDYMDNVSVDDVVYAAENEELEITEEDLQEDMIKSDMRTTLKALYPKASFDEMVYWTRLLREKYGIRIVPADVVVKEIWRDNFKKAPLLQKIKMLLKAMKQKIFDLFKKDDRYMRF